LLAPAHLLAQACSYAAGQAAGRPGLPPVLVNTGAIGPSAANAAGVAIGHTRTGG